MLEAKREYDKAWRAANPDKTKAYKNKATKEQLHAWDRARYQRDKEKIKARVKAWTIANKEKVIEWRRKHRMENKERLNDYAKTYAAAHKAEAAKRGRYWAIAKKYGLSEEQYQAMLTGQGGVCAICLKEPDEGKHLCVDHDHGTGVVRGLLCRNCNAAIGQLGDSIFTLKIAIAYLEQHSTATTPDNKEISN